MRCQFCKFLLLSTTFFVYPPCATTWSTICSTETLNDILSVIKTSSVEDDCDISMGPGEKWPAWWLAGVGLSGNAVAFAIIFSYRHVLIQQIITNFTWNFVSTQSEYPHIAHPLHHLDALQGVALSVSVPRNLAASLILRPNNSSWDSKRSSRITTLIHR